jgi:GT2 family glycosyltransferase
LSATVQGTSLFDGEIEWLFMEQGGSDENYELFMSLPILRKVVIRQENYGINNGLNQLWALSRGEFCLILENDWLNHQPNFNFVHQVKQIMADKPDVGIVQLRAVGDPNENWGFGKPEYSPWSCSNDALKAAGVKLFSEVTSTGLFYSIAEFPNGFNNNPNVIRKSLYRECGPYPEPPIGTDPRHGETEYQQRVAETGCAIAHIGTELYYHCGQMTTPGV